MNNLFLGKWNFSASCCLSVDFRVWENGFPNPKSKWSRKTQKVKAAFKLKREDEANQKLHQLVVSHGYVGDGGWAIWHCQRQSWELCGVLQPQSKFHLLLSRFLAADFLQLEPPVLWNQWGICQTGWCISCVRNRNLRNFTDQLKSKQQDVFCHLLLALVVCLSENTVKPGKKYNLVLCWNQKSMVNRHESQVGKTCYDARRDVGSCVCIYEPFLNLWPL